MKSIILAAIASVFALGSMATVSPALAQEKQKTVAACQAEWVANKADYKAKGVTEKAYVKQCRAGTASATTGAANNAAPAPSPAASPSAKSTNNAGATTTTHSRARTAATPAADNQFSSEGQAKSHCPSDTVVWANLTSHIYHFAGNRSYGKTKKGAYMCEKEATSGGFRAAKAEKHPS